jgi:hypothetical protein
MPNRKLIPSLLSCGVFIFNTLLLALFCLQAGVCFLLLRNGYIPLPANSINQWLKENPYEGFFAKGEAFQLTASGRVRVIQPEAISHDSNDLVLRAQHLDLFLKLKPQPIARVSLYRGQLFQPTAFNKNGSTRLILDKLGLDFIPEKETFHIKALQAHRDKLRLRASASISRQSLQRIAPKADGKVDLLQTIFTAFEKTELIDPLIAQSEHPIISLSLNKNSSDSHSLKISVQFDGHVIQTAKIRAEGISFASKAMLSTDGLTLAEDIRFEAKVLEMQEQNIRLENNDGTIFAQNPEELLKNKWPDAQIRTDSLKYNKYALDNLALSIKSESLDSLHITGLAEGINAGLTFDADLNLTDYSGHLTASGRCQSGEIHPLLATPTLPKINFTKNGIFELNTNWEPDFQSFRSSIYASLPGTELNGVVFDSLQFSAHHVPGQIEIERLSFDRKNQWAELSFSQDLTTKNYSLSTQGNLIPKEYNSFMPVWWRNIFNHNFEFSPQSIATGDCVVYGNSSLLSADFYYGSFDVEAIKYRDVPITNGSLTLRGRNRYTEIHELQANSGKDWLNGDIHFAGYRDAIRAPAAIRYKLEGKLPLESIRKIVSEEISENLSNFEMDQAPHLILEAAQFREADYPQFKGNSYLKLLAQASEPLVFNNVDFDYLNFELWAQENELYLREIEFGLADGIGTGRIDRRGRTTKETPLLNYDLNLKDADYLKARIAFDQFNGVVAEEPASNGSLNKDPKDNGVLTLQLRSIGPANDFNQHSGNGSFVLKHNALATIQLLGPFSMILENTLLGFTSLQLDSMRGEFGIADGFLKFSPLIILGDQALIEANGTLRLDDQALDMIIGVNLIGNLSEKINPFKIITDVVNPLNYLMQFKLEGTLRDQKIRSLYDPRNFLPF